MADMEETRYRSFAERYIIERASTFRAGHEREDAWAAMLDARGMYEQVAIVGARLTAKEIEEKQQAYDVSVKHNPTAKMVQEKMERYMHAYGLSDSEAREAHQSAMKHATPSMMASPEMKPKAKWISNAWKACARSKLWKI